jgi:SNF2 family DNA or RNA helicase
MSTQQFLMDAATRHQVFLQRYGNGRSKEAVKLLNRLRKKINARLAQEPTDFQAQRLQDVLKDVDSLTKLTMGDIKKLILLDALEFAATETEFTASMLNRVSSVTFALPAEAALIAAVETTPNERRSNERDHNTRSTNPIRGQKGRSDITRNYRRRIARRYNTKHSPKAGYHYPHNDEAPSQYVSQHHH